MDAPVCRICGTRREPGTADALAWAHEPDRDRWLCPACARAHARDIEARLPDEWWTA